jgi:hypothetical protein
MIKSKACLRRYSMIHRHINNNNNNNNIHSTLPMRNLPLSMCCLVTPETYLDRRPLIRRHIPSGEGVVLNQDFVCG